MKKRMKKLYKFAITGILCVVLMSCFTITSFAASYFRIYATFSSFKSLFYYYDGLDNLDERGDYSDHIHYQADGSGGLVLPVNSTAEGAGIGLYSQQSFRVEVGDVIAPGSWTFGGWCEHPLKSITLRFVGVDDSGNDLILNLLTTNYNYTSDHTYHFALSSKKITVRKSMTITGLEILYEFTEPSDFPFDISINKASNFVADIGNPNSPEFPGYDDVGDPGTGELSNVEDQIMGQLDKDSFTETLEGIGVLGTTNFYGKSLLFASRVLTTALDEIPFLSAIVRLSLAIGIVAFLFGIVSTVGRIIDKNAQKNAAKKGG